MLRPAAAEIQTLIRGWKDALGQPLLIYLS
jgi:hypothetical protein